MQLSGMYYEITSQGCNEADQIKVFSMIEHISTFFMRNSLEIWKVKTLFKLSISKKCAEFLQLCRVLIVELTLDYDAQS